MSENDSSVKKVSWWEGVKAEFKKIIWPDKKTLVRETIAVFVTTVILGLVIVLIDYVVQLGLDHIIR
jgi:preprotein translocase subunit SecE